MRRPKSTHQFSKALRGNQTDAEKKLWKELRAGRFMGIHFKRQVSIGDFIVDFCSSQRRIVIELDGGQHASAQEEDASRTRFLESQGYKVVRFWNSEILANMEGVLESLRRGLETPPPP